MKRFLLIAGSLLLAFPGIAQRNRLQFIRVSEDNDALNIRREVTDREYTNGTRLDMFYTKNVKPRFPSTLLIPISSDDATDAGESVHNLYNIGLTQLMYTPSDISRSEIIMASRPYTAALYVTHGLTSSDAVHQQRLTTELGVGVMGKAALGQQTQIWIHGLFGYDKPQGWSHQLPTDVVINYLIQYEKLIVQPSPYLQIMGVLSTNVGTLNNNINAGIMFRAGIFGNYFSNFERPGNGRKQDYLPNHRKTQFFFFMRPVGRLVMDDALLQGGFFSHKSAEHVIDRDLLNRGFVQFEYGAVLLHNRYGISFSEKLITPQYQGAPSQQVGNITLYIGL